MNDNSFISKWISIKPCEEQRADYILMKMEQQEKKCDKCARCVGEACDIYTSSEEAASLGKYLIDKAINN